MTEARVLEAHGPCRFDSAGACSPLTSSVAKSPGVYLWGIELADGLLVRYVGQTGRSFEERLQEHVDGYLSGLYRLYDPDGLAKGELRPVWDGLWKPGTRERKGEFLSRYDRLSSVISQTLQLMRVLLIPIDKGERTRERVEAAIALHLRGQPGPVGSFQNDDIRYRPRRSDEAPVRLKLELPLPIHGLPDVLDV